MALNDRIDDLATSVATELKKTRVLLNNNALDLSSLTTTDKTNLVAAINEVNASSGGGGAQIDDTTASTTTVYSSSKTDSQIAAAKDEILGGASSAYDTLLELEGAVTDNDSAIAGLTTSIGEKVSYTAAQTLTAAQQTQARTNIDAASATAVGNTDADFVATFEAGLV